MGINHRITVLLLMATGFFHWSAFLFETNPLGAYTSLADKARLIKQANASNAVHPTKNGIATASAGVFPIEKFGAVGDGKTDNTEAIQKAIEACSAAGGGRVLVNKGIFVSGTILLQSKVELHLEEGAELRGSTDVKKYQLVEAFKDGKGQNMGYAFIGIKEVRNVSITGKGTINGNGKALLDLHGRAVRPFLIRVVRAQHLNIQDVHLTGPAAWTVHLFQSQLIAIDRVSIFSRGLGNNDGIDVDGCETVIIKNCNIDSGDDAICFKATSSKGNKNIEVVNCQLNTNHGAIKFGTESMGNFENIKIHHCKIISAKGIKIFSVDGAQLRQVEISDIEADKLHLPIMIRLGARLRSFREGERTKPVGSINGLVIRNIKVKEATQMAVLISGIPGHRVQNVVIENVSCTLPGEGKKALDSVVLAENIADYPEVTMFGKDMPVSSVYIRHAEQIQLKNIQVTTKKPEERTSIYLSDVQQLEWKNSTVPAPASNLSLLKVDSSRKIILSNLGASQKPAQWIRKDDGTEVTWEKLSTQ
jgi:polygalacturonase